MATGYLRDHSTWRQGLFQNPRSVISAPTAPADHAGDDLEPPNLTIRLKSMVKPRHKTILQTGSSDCRVTPCR